MGDHTRGAGGAEPGAAAAGAPDAWRAARALSGGAATASGSAAAESPGLQACRKLEAEAALYEARVAVGEERKRAQLYKLRVVAAEEECQMARSERNILDAALLSERSAREAAERALAGTRAELGALRERVGRLSQLLEARAAEVEHHRTARSVAARAATDDLRDAAAAREALRLAEGDLRASRREVAALQARLGGDRGDGPAPAPGGGRAPAPAEAAKEAAKEAARLKRQLTDRDRELARLRAEVLAARAQPAPAAAAPAAPAAPEAEKKKKKPRGRPSKRLRQQLVEQPAAAATPAGGPALEAELEELLAEEVEAPHPRKKAKKPAPKPAPAEPASPSSSEDEAEEDEDEAADEAGAPPGRPALTNVTSIWDLSKNRSAEVKARAKGGKGAAGKGGRKLLQSSSIYFDKLPPSLLFGQDFQIPKVIHTKKK